MARAPFAMNAVGKLPIFISHASEDAALASSLQSLIEAALRRRPSERLVFRSTDVSAIEGGADWYEAIINALRQSRICLSLFTPTSVYKPWVIYESGGAYAIYRQKARKLIAVCAAGITPELVPSPLKRLQTRRLRSGPTRLDSSGGVYKCNPGELRVIHGPARVAHATHTSARGGG